MQSAQARGGDTSVAWVAIQGPASLVGNIVQVGFGKCYPITQAGNCNSLTSDHDFYAYGRDPSSPGCSGYSPIYPIGHWDTHWGGGGVYSVREFSAKDFWIDAPSWSLYLSSGTICWTNATVAVTTESWDYGDALGGESTDRLVVNQAQFKITPNENWRSLPVSCNARQGIDANGHPFALEQIFKCAGGSGYIALYTDR